MLYREIPYTTNRRNWWYFDSFPKKYKNSLLCDIHEASPKKALLLLFAYCNSPFEKKIRFFIHPILFIYIETIAKVQRKMKIKYYLRAECI